MSNVIFPVVFLVAGALQLYAAFAVARATGPLKTLQARQLEGALGRKGTVAFFLVIGIALVSCGAWFGLTAMASTG